jgi:general secretion pathway protein J
VIALTLFGIISVVLFSALRLGGRLWERVDEVGERMATLHAAEALLRRTLAQARPTFRTTELKLLSLFAGDASRLDFVAPLSSYVGAPGLQLLRLQVAGQGEDQRLWLTRWLLHPEVLAGGGGTPPWSPDEIEPPPDDRASAALDAGEAESGAFGHTELLRGLSGVQLSYFGQKVTETEPQWHEDWVDQEGLPLLVRIRLALAGQRWPDLVVAPGGG